MLAGIWSLAARTTLAGELMTNNKIGSIKLLILIRGLPILRSGKPPTPGGDHFLFFAAISWRTFLRAAYASHRNRLVVVVHESLPGSHQTPSRSVHHLASKLQICWAAADASQFGQCGNRQAGKLSCRRSIQRGVAFVIVV